MSDDPYKTPSEEPEHSAATRSRLVRTVVIAVIGLYVGEHFFLGNPWDSPRLLAVWLLNSAICVAATWFVFNVCEWLVGNKNAAFNAPEPTRAT